MYGSGVGSLQVKIKKSDGTYVIKDTGLYGSQVGNSYPL